MGFGELIEEQAEEIARLRENLDRLESQIDRGWVPLYGNYSEDDGPSLEQLHQVAKRNRELMALNPHIGNGLELINSYVWADGIHYGGIRGKGRGRGVNVQALIDDPINQDNFFGQLARKQRQTAFYTDGNVFYWGESEGGVKRLHPMSVTEITDDYRNPEKTGEIWAYRREWRKKNTNGTVETRHEWIFANKFAEKRGNAKTINYGGKDEPIAVNKVMFVAKSNPVVGWAYGVSDVQRGIAWAEDYRLAMLDGKQMNASMAAILAQVKNSGSAGANAAALALGNMQGAGGFANIGQGNAIQTLSTAGQAYDFARLLPLLANFAAGIGVSVIALSMNSGNAGGSYGAARSLDRPEQLSTQMRRAYNKALDIEVLTWLGADPEELDVWFDPIIDPTEKYRAEQIIELRLGTGLYKGEEIKRMHALLDGRDPDKITAVPDGWLIPQNKESIELRTIDPNVSGNPATGGSFAPTQGSGAKSTPTGGSNQKSDDIRTNREFMELQDKVDGLQSLLTEVLRAVRGE